MMPLLIATLEGETEVYFPSENLGASFFRRQVRKATNVTKQAVSGAMKAGRVVGHAVMTAGRAAQDAAKAIIRKVAEPIIAKALGDEAGELVLFGADEAAMTPATLKARLRAKKAALVAAVTAAAGGAVAASGVAAPAAPLVAGLVPGVVDELIESMGNKAAKGVQSAAALAPAPAAPTAESAAAAPIVAEAATAAALAPAPASGLFTPRNIGIAAAVGAGLFFLSRRGR